MISFLRFSNKKKTCMEISKEEALALRGLCISLVVLHNLIHNVVPFHENEKWYDLSNADFFIHNITSHPILGLLSYVGWMGVPIFFFFCGYGLEKKYGRSIGGVSNFLTKHYLKLFFLFGPIMIINNLHAHKPYIDILGQLTFLNNLLSDEKILPAAFWYVRCAFEFYILYGLFLYRVNSKHLLFVGGAISLSLVFFDNNIVRTMRYHCLGWFLDFSLGCYIATAPNVLKYIENRFSILFLFILLVLSTVQQQLWVYSDAFMILFVIAIRRYVTNYLFIFVGSVSAYLYAIHPLIRNVWLYLKIDYMNDSWYYIMLSIVLYFCLCLIGAYAYKYAYKKIETTVMR